MKTPEQFISEVPHNWIRRVDKDTSSKCIDSYLKVRCLIFTLSIAVNVYRQVSWSN